MLLNEAPQTVNVEMIVARPISSRAYYLEKGAHKVPNSKLVRMTDFININIPTGRGLVFGVLVAYRAADSGAVMVSKEQAQCCFSQIQF